MVYNHPLSIALFSLTVSMHLLGTGDVIRGIITKIADIGSGNRRGGQIVEDGKQEVREGVREITT
jgi:hypothetical protein